MEENEVVANDAQTISYDGVETPEYDGVIVPDASIVSPDEALLNMKSDISAGLNDLVTGFQTDMEQEGFQTAFMNAAQKVMGDLGPGAIPVIAGGMFGGLKGAAIMGVGQYVITSYMESNPEVAQSVSNYVDGFTHIFNAFGENGEPNYDMGLDNARDAMNSMSRESSLAVKETVTPSAPEPVLDKGEMEYA